jgi:FAD synthase
LTRIRVPCFTRNRRLRFANARSRLANFEVLGIEQAIVIRFNRDFAGQHAEDFLYEIVHDRLHAKEVYLGKGFALERTEAAISICFEK